VSGAQEYDRILVYDISRWGRFQDADEAGHYEFLCRSAGISVHYCAETFANDGTFPSVVMKTLKRAMAAEYSRELGVKVFDGRRRSPAFSTAGGSAFVVASGRNRLCLGFYETQNMPDAVLGVERPSGLGDGISIFPNHSGSKGLMHLRLLSTKIRFELRTTQCTPEHGLSQMKNCLSQFAHCSLRKG